MLASKFFSVVGKTTGDNELKKKIKKGDMSVEAITDTIHEYMYEKVNESRDSEETQIKHVDRRRNNQKPEKEKPSKYKRVDCIRYGAPNWNKQPGKNKEMPKLRKNGPLRKTVPNQTKTGPEDKTHLPGIRSNLCRRGWLVTKQNTTHNKNGPVNETNHQRRTTILYYNSIGQQPSNQIHNRQRSPVTLIPKQMFNKITPIRPLHTEYRDGNNNKIKFEGKTTAKVETNWETKNLELLITTKRTIPLLGLDWMKYLGIKLETEKNSLKIQNVQEDPDVMKLKRKLKNLFYENKRIKGMEVDIQLKPDAKLIQQNGRAIPIHLQPAVGKKLEKLKKNGHIERATNINGNCFVSPAVITPWKKVKRGKLL